MPDRRIPQAAIPLRRTDDHAEERHASFLARAKAGPIDLLFLGDSITRRWAEVPELWEENFGRYESANFGVGGDETQNLLWRIENGELEGITPRLVVLLIGTNNAPRDRGRDIAEAVRGIVRTIRSRLPAARMLLLAIFPRGPGRGEEGYGADSRKTAKAIAEANRALSRLDGEGVRFADLGRLFLDERGRTRADLMPDRLHLGRKGYEALGPELRRLVDEFMRK